MEMKKQITTEDWRRSQIESIQSIIKTLKDDREECGEKIDLLTYQIKHFQEVEKLLITRR